MCWRPSALRWSRRSRCSSPARPSARRSSLGCSLWASIAVAGIAALRGRAVGAADALAARRPAEAAGGDLRHRRSRRASGRAAAAPAPRRSRSSACSTTVPGAASSATGLRELPHGTTAELVEMSRQFEIDRIVVALPHSAEQRLLEILRKLHKMPVEISLAPDMVGFNVPAKDHEEFGGLPLLDVYGRPLTFGQTCVKTVFDRARGGARDRRPVAAAARRRGRDQARQQGAGAVPAEPLRLWRPGDRASTSSAR